MTEAPSPGATEAGSPAAVRPPALRPGDEVAIVAPAGPVDADRLRTGLAMLRSWGLRPRLGRHAAGRLGYLAGTDTERLTDLQDALDDPAIRAVVCARGGYGTQRLVDRLDLARLRDDPKLVVGFSDVTALHLAAWRAAHLATVHGPGAAFPFATAAAEVADALRTALFVPEPVVLSPDPAEPTVPVRTSGRATGTLLGGNLTLLAASAGTPDLPRLAGAVLLLEDVGEAPYRLDRMVTQLIRCGALDGVVGVAVGQFTGCAGAPGEPSAADVLSERLGTLDVPVLGGLPVGHGTAPRTVPLGVPATLDADAGTLTVCPAVR